MDFAAIKQRINDRAGLINRSNGIYRRCYIAPLVARRSLDPVLVRETSDRTHLKNMQTEIYVGDLGEQGVFAERLRGCDALIHTAAEYRLWTANPNNMIASNITGTGNILSAAGEAGVSNMPTPAAWLHWVSSRDEPVTELTPSELKDKVGLYKRSKFLAEQKALHTSGAGSAR